MTMKYAMAALLALSAAPAWAQYLPQNVSAGRVVEACLTPTVSVGNAYGTNFVQGGLLTFPNLLPSSGGAAIQSVYVDTVQVETMGWTFTPLDALPTATTWTDAAVAAIATADKKLPRGPISVTGSSVLGTHTAGLGSGSGQVLMTTSAAPPTLLPLYGVLTTNAAMTANFASTSDLTICVDVVQFP